MKDKLAKLSLEQLIELRNTAAELIQERASKELRVGKIASFLKVDGQREYIIITKVNPKTIIGKGYDINSKQVSGINWKVSKHLVTPYVEPKKPEPKPTGIGADRPAMVGGW